MKMLSRTKPPCRAEDDQLTAQMLGVALTLAASRTKSENDPESVSIGASSVVSDLLSLFDGGFQYMRKLSQRMSRMGTNSYSDTAFSELIRAEWIDEGGGS